MCDGGARRRPDVRGLASSRAGGSKMRVESRVFSVSWVPSDVVSGVARLPFAISVARADAPPPERLDDPHELVRSGAARQANDLRAWVEFGDDGRPVDFGYGD